MAVSHEDGCGESGSVRRNCHSHDEELEGAEVGCGANLQRRHQGVGNGEEVQVGHRGQQSGWREERSVVMGEG